MPEALSSPQGSRLRQLLAKREDPYAGADLHGATQMGAILWVGGVLAVFSLAPLSPPTAAIGKAGWVVAAFLVLAALAAAWRLRVQGARINTKELMAQSYGALAAITTLIWLSGGRGSGYERLYLLAVLYVAAVHPPRRVIPFLGTFAGGVALAFAVAPWTTMELGDAILQVVIVTLVALVTLTLMDGIRSQRVTLRAEGSAALLLSRTDPLTGLRNRRALTEDLAEACAGADPERPGTLLLFDLDGFKVYNDTYGHAAGDELLVRLAGRLTAAVGDPGRTYRMGGDEFCVLTEITASAELVGHAVAALAEEGEGFVVTASHGEVLIPTEASDPSCALRRADQRMYARKSVSRVSASRQSADVLVKVLAERDPDLGAHLDGVASLCEAVADRLGVADEEIMSLLQAAALHDVGKAAVPDAILEKPGPLTEEEWEFMRRHTIVGERILGAAPSLARAGRIVRASHERYDGTGYPDGLAGEQIPVGARIIAVCDAFDAMTSDRPYRAGMPAEAALEELHRCAGSQFDPDVVTAFHAVMAEREPAGAARPALA